MPKPSCSSSDFRPASSRYSATVLEPGASELLTQGLRVSPSRFALRASRPRRYVARVARVGAARDRRDDHRAVRQLARHVLPLTGDAFGGEVGRRDAVRAGSTGPPWCAPPSTGRTRAGVRTCAVLQAVRPEPRHLRVGFNQLDLLGVAAGEPQVVEGLRIDEEHRRSGAVFGRHVGDGRAVAERQARSALTVKLEIGTDDLRLAQELGQREHDIGRRDARLPLARELHADDLRQAHPRGAAEHDVFGLETTHADGDHAECIDMRRVAVGADAGIRERDAVDRVDHGRHLLQVDLVHDAVAGRDHVDVVERAACPLDEVKAVFVATVLDRAVLLERLRVEAAVLDRERVVDDELYRHDRVHLGRVTALVCDGVAQSGEIDQRGLAQDVVADDAGREPREVAIAPAVGDLLQALVENRRVAAAHEILRVHARGVRQPVPRAGTDGVRSLRARRSSRGPCREAACDERSSRAPVSYFRFSSGTNF